MKSIFEMTAAEILALDADAIQLAIDLECATRGVPLAPPDPGPAPSRDIPQPDLTFYEVAGVTVSTLQDAQTVFEVLSQLSLYKEEHKGGHWETKYAALMTVEDYYYPKIAAKRLYSPELFSKIIAEKTQLAAELKGWKKRKEEYDEAQKLVAEVSEEVWERVNEVRAIDAQRNQLRSIFERYLTLADGNTTVAMNFLRGAHGGVPEDLIQELCPGYNTAQ